MRAGKDRLYADFASKDGLYPAVIEQWPGQITDGTALDVADLPDTPGGMFDHYLPENARLQAWAEVRATGIPAAENAVRRIIATEISEIEHGQREGLVTTDFQPVALVAMLTDLVPPPCTPAGRRRRTTSPNAGRGCRPHAGSPPRNDRADHARMLGVCRKSMRAAQARA
ncbi:hypothetical protein [Nocardia sp. bgisy134]|uniref:hypothetical protein n=1 Tax=Nocardia sp. bgisy134 TaxID=3413789 RepID=UPI003D765B78